MPARPRPSLKTRVLDGELGGYLLLAPAVLVLLVLTVWPLLYSVSISLTNYSLGLTASIKFIGLDNYQHLFDDTLFTGSLWTTGELLLVALPVQLVLGYLCARILLAAQGMFGARLLRTLFIIPTMMTSLAVALFWDYILDPLLGVANWLLGLVNLPVQPWFSPPARRCSPWPGCICGSGCRSPRSC